MIRPQQEGLLTRCGYRLDWKIDSYTNTLMWVELQAVSSDSFFNIEINLGHSSITYAAGGTRLCTRYSCNLIIPKSHGYSEAINYIRIRDTKDSSNWTIVNDHVIKNEIKTVYYIRNFNGTWWNASAISFTTDSHAATSFSSRYLAEQFIKINNISIGSFPLFIESAYDFK